MVKKIILLCCISTNTLFAQLNINSPLTIADTFGNSHPQIELTGDGNPIVTWTNFSKKNIYASKFENNGFLAPIKLNPLGLDVQSYTWSGPDLCIENSNVYAIFRSDGYETGHVYLVKSTNNGQSFSDTMRVDHLSAGFAQYPDLAVLNDTIYTTFMDHDAMGMSPQYVLSRSFDGGLTFENPILAGELTGDEACDCCPPEIIVNNDYVIILFRNNANNVRDIKGAISYDRGATFTNIANVDNHLWTLQSCPSTGPDGKIDQNNIMHTVYKSYENLAGKVFLNSYDLTQNVSVSTQNLANGVNNTNFPQITLKNDLIGIVFEGNGSATDVFFNYSLSGIQGVNPSMLMNLTNVTGAQSKPDIIADNNSFHIVYSDVSKLSYVKIDVLVDLKELEKKSKIETLIYSKSKDKEIEIFNSLLYNFEGRKIDMNDFSKLSLGNYYIVKESEKIVQKLIIIP